MSDVGAIEMVLSVQRTAVLKRILPELIPGAGVLYWVHHRIPEQFMVFCVAIVVVYGYALYIPVRLLITGEAVVITDRGLIDRTSGLRYVAWSEIRAATLYPFMGVTLLVALDLVNVQSVIARMSPVRRWLMRYYLRRPGARPTIAAPFVEGGPEALCRLINQRVRGDQTGRAV